MDSMPPVVPETDAEAEDARMIGRKGTRRGGVEIITRGERRRSWTLEQKREIVAESLRAELTRRRSPASTRSAVDYSTLGGSKFWAARSVLSPAPRRVLPGLSWHLGRSNQTAPSWERPSFPRYPQHHYHGRRV